MLQASFLGAAAAAIQVQRLGNVPVSASDLRHQIARTHAAHLAYAAPETIETRAPLAARV
jgi:bifunctional ADP-heptose synthase (sugar kinase/adenylyltransferase)